MGHSWTGEVRSAMPSLSASVTVAGCVLRFQSTTAVYLRRADAFVMVYDVTSRSSFKSVRAWLSLAKVSAMGGSWV